MDENRDALLWRARHFVYSYWVEHTHPPDSRAAARALGVSEQEARDLYQALHDRHALVLMPGSSAIRMANPFSGVPTHFTVRVPSDEGTKQYYANCAWDSFGIPAALHTAARIEAFCAQTQEPLRLAVQDDKVQGDAAVVHFVIPFAHWYDDVVFT